jgi:hypothetical protein
MSVTWLGVPERAGGVTLVKVRRCGGQRRLFADDLVTTLRDQSDQYNGDAASVTRVTAHM